MSMFNQMIQGNRESYPMESKPSYQAGVKQRTFREAIQDQMAFHESKRAELQAVLDSLTLDVENFIEAMQKLG